jgi:hypothetical protein
VHTPSSVETFVIPSEVVTEALAQPYANIAGPGSNDPSQPDAYRGGGELTLKNLKSKSGAFSSEDELIELVHSWQRDSGLELSADTDQKYIYQPEHR